MFENADLYRTNGESAILMHFHAIVPDIYTSIWRTGDHSSNKLYMIFEQCETMGKSCTKFLVIVVLRF